MFRFHSTQVKTLLSVTGLFLITILVGCTSGSGDEMLHSVAPDDLTAEMRLVVLSDRGSEKEIGIVIQNPDNYPIQSVRAWVKFDSSAVSITNLSQDEERLSLTAPGEMEIDSEEGFVKIGVASASPLREGVLNVASFKVRVIGESPILTFHDWREDGTGHVAVLMINEEGKAVNVLSAPSSISL